MDSPAATAKSPRASCLGCMPEGIVYGCIERSKAALDHVSDRFRTSERVLSSPSINVSNNLLRQPDGNSRISLSRDGHVSFLV